MGIWAVISNIGTIISLLKSLSSLIGFVAKDKSMPPKEMIKDVLDHIEALLDSGAIDIPSVDEKQISEALKQIEAQLLA